MRNAKCLWFSFHSNVHDWSWIFEIRCILAPLYIGLTFQDFDISALWQFISTIRNCAVKIVKYEETHRRWVIIEIKVPWTWSDLPAGDYFPPANRRIQQTVINLIGKSRQYCHCHSIVFLTNCRQSTTVDWLSAERSQYSFRKVQSSYLDFAESTR